MKHRSGISTGYSNNAGQIGSWRAALGTSLERLRFNKLSWKEQRGRLHTDRAPARTAGVSDAPTLPSMRKTRFFRAVGPGNPSHPREAQLSFEDPPMILRLCLPTVFAALLAPSLFAQNIPAFPGAEGFGAYAKGGRGGDVYHRHQPERLGRGLVLPRDRPRCPRPGGRSSSR